MIYDNSTGDTFTQFYNDDPLGFLNKRFIDTKEARDRCLELLATIDTIMDELNRIEKSDGKTDLWSRYTRGELPHIYCSKDPLQNAFLDALSIQAERIRKNIKKKYTISDEEIDILMFSE